MMNEMVERVARALCRAAAINAYPVVDPGPVLDAIVEAAWEYPKWEEYARVAIAAMREPTIQMQQSSSDLTSVLLGTPLDGLSATTFYQAMIDEALK